MKKYLLPENGNFYKANMHCHTTISDGKMTPEEIKARYKEKGYSIVAFTDHDVLIPHPELADETFLPLNGYEMEVVDFQTEISKFRKTAHMCFVALDPDNLKQVCYHREKYLFGNAPSYKDQIQFDETLPDFEREYTPACISEMMKQGRENGFFVTYNHPTWSLEHYEDYMNYHHMHAMEIYNHECVLIGDYDYNERVYDDMLRGGKHIYCFATDDTHAERAVGGGYIMIKADKLEYKTITDALLAGNFYASCGPEIHKLWMEDGTLYVECSDAASIRFNTASRRGHNELAKEGKLLQSASFAVLPDDGYVRVTITDSCGNHANTHAYFVEELLDSAK